MIFMPAPEPVSNPSQDWCDKYADWWEGNERPKVGEIADRVTRDVAELPDRTSPDEWPEAMLVTEKELRAIVIRALTQ